MEKIFYYDDESENLLEEEDAEKTTYEEVEDELFNLEDDDTSYVGVISWDGNRHKVKCDCYDSYKIYLKNTNVEYDLINIVDFENCKSYFKNIFGIREKSFF